MSSPLFFEKCLKAVERSTAPILEVKEAYADKPWLAESKQLELPKTVNEYDTFLDLARLTSDLVEENWHDLSDMVQTSEDIPTALQRIALYMTVERPTTE